MHYTPSTFTIPELKGISKKNIEEHLKLYEGYVKHANLILEKLEQYAGDEIKTYECGELQRRFAFEFDGMRNHEYYFRSFEGGASELSGESALSDALSSCFGSFDAWLSKFKSLAVTRGIGWAMLWYDPHKDELIIGWVDEQHLGHLTGLIPVLTLDMWEHSFVADYQPSGKKQYVEDFFENLNWDVIEQNYATAKNAAIA